MIIIEDPILPDLSIIFCFPNIKHYYRWIHMKVKINAKPFSIIFYNWTKQQTELHVSNVHNTNNIYVDEREQYGIITQNSFVIITTQQVDVPLVLTQPYHTT